jgi:hypothetical protein
MSLMDFSLLSITLNILAPIGHISFITISCIFSYQHVNLFNEFDDKFGKLNKGCWIGMFNVECIGIPSILKTTLLINAISKALVFVKSKYVFIV